MGSGWRVVAEEAFAEWDRDYHPDSDLVYAFWEWCWALAESGPIPDPDDDDFEPIPGDEVSFAMRVPKLHLQIGLTVLNYERRITITTIEPWWL